MSEAAERGREVWIEKYRPQTLDEVAGHENITSRLRSYIERNDLPHLLFAGPAGVGKCVTGETPVLTNRGVERIEDVVGAVDGFAEPDDDLRVVTYDHGEFEYVEPSHVFGKRAEGLVQVSTRDGNELTVTPEHRLLTVGHDGTEWKQAADLESGDRVVRPRRTPTVPEDAALDWVDAMDGDRTLVHVTETFAAEHDVPVDEDYVGVKKQVVAGLRAGQTPSEITDRVDTTQKTVASYARQVADRDLDEPSTVCSLAFLRNLGVSRSELREHVTAIQYVTPQNRRSTPITPPWQVTPELARFVGLAVSEARIERGRIKFYNVDEGLLAQFTDAAESVFDVTPREGEQQDVPYRELTSRTLTHLLESCFAVFGESGDEAIGSALLGADEEARSAFLQAVFDSEAHIAENGHIELTQKDGDVLTLVSYLLAGFGVPSRRKTVTKRATNGAAEATEYQALYVSSASHLRRFEETVGFTLEDKRTRLARCTSRDGNPNDDTIPTQSAVDTLCAELHLNKSDYVPERLNPDTPGRESYQAALERVLGVATDRLETAQEVLARLGRMEAKLDAMTAVPSQWTGARASLEPLETRKAVAETVNVRTDRLLEYADGRRTPSAERAGTLLSELGVLDERPATEGIQTELREAIAGLGVSFEQLAEGTDLRGTDVANRLEGGHGLGSLTRFQTVAERVREEASSMCSTEVLEALQTLDVVASDDLYFDEVTAVQTVDEPQRVYDLTVPETRSYVAGAVPTVMHNTTCAVAIAKELYGDEWRENFLELNASDQRGIDVVRDRIKNFARSSFGGHDYRVIFLDEADALTSDAQSALRRTMEQFSNNTRFILSCNYSSQIIDPIQSRCAVFRFSPLSDEAVEGEIREIAASEGIDVTDDGIDALVYAADGDMRKAINGLQAAAVMGETVDEEGVYAITSTARPEDIKEMVTLALEGDFTQARSQLDYLLTDVGIAGGDIIDQLHRSVWEFDLSDRETVRLMDRIGEADYRISAGANEQVQLEALLASLALED